MADDRLGSQVQVRTRPRQLAAIQWTGENSDEVQAFLAPATDKTQYVLFPERGEGRVAVWVDGARTFPMAVNDWILLPDGIPRFCSNGAFESIYEIVTGDA